MCAVAAVIHPSAVTRIALVENLILEYFGSDESGVIDECVGGDVGVGRQRQRQRARCQLAALGPLQ